jgi:large subunit ribosomal protein L9
MEVILLKDVEKLGYKHDLVAVKPGFGRNYLIPNGFALIANEINRKKLEDLKAKEAAVEAARLSEYVEIAAKLKDVTLKIGAKSGTSGKIFGSITNVQIGNALKEQCEVEIDRRKIVLPDEVKDLGTYEVTLNLHPEVTTQVAFEVIAE